MLFGGSRSGKTFLAVYAIVVRALKSSGSRHAILRFRFNAVKASIVFDTFPKVMRICFPQVRYDLNKTDWIVEFENGSQIWFGGLDDKERTEKILGQEFATIYLNECSQIPWGSVGIAVTRLAQSCTQEINGSREPLPLRMLFDCNPPDKNHWTYKVFVQKIDPDTKQAITNQHLYGAIQMNPKDNEANLPPAYLATLEGLPGHLRRRFLLGEFKDANPNALFSEESIDRWRTEDSSDLPDMVRIVVAVDPSGSDDENNETNDDIGLVVAGLGTDGNGYILEDATLKAGPAVWGRMAVSAYERHQADVIVGEQNFGGAMVKFVIKTADPNVRYKVVNASRGKVQRAEPFSALFETGKVRIVGRMNLLEEELGGFSTNGYTGARSPNRADAAFWALAELFPGIVKAKKEQKKPTQSIRFAPNTSTGWMGS
jgi:phage terminase large subunit-like protein